MALKEVNIENIINEKLSGDTKKNALDFFKWMTENKFTFRERLIDGNEWRGRSYKGSKQVHSIWFSGDEMALWMGSSKFNKKKPVSDELKEFAWFYVVNCPQEVCKSREMCKSSVESYELFGKSFGRVCHAPMAFFNPSVETYENLKELMLLF